MEPNSGLIAAYELTAGNVGDVQAAPELLASETEPGRGCSPSAYGSGPFRAHLAAQDHLATI